MNRIHLRSGLATLAILIVAGVVWFYFAPTAIGGSSRYVVTSGVSMEPRFHTNFIDPDRPRRSELLGKLWLHVPHARRVLEVLQTPVLATLLCVVLGP